MKQLRGDTVATGLVQSLWLQRLPEGTRVILACAAYGLHPLPEKDDPVPRCQYLRKAPGHAGTTVNSLFLLKNLDLPGTLVAATRKAAPRPLTIYDP